MSRRVKTDLRLRDLARVRSAERLLRMGEPGQALRELQRLTRQAWNHPWTEQVMWRAAQAIG